MNKYLASIVAELIGRADSSGQLTLNEVADAVGVHPVSAQDIEAIFDALERAGKRVVAPKTGSGVEHLRKVLPSARRLRGELGRSPTVEEIASDASLSADAVRHALALARIMGR